MVTPCTRHPFEADPACPHCYPSAVDCAPVPAAEAAERDTTPIPYTARDAMNTALLEQLTELPLEVREVGQLFHAVALFRRLVNWYVHTYASDRGGGVPWHVLSEADQHFIPGDRLDEGARFFGRDSHEGLIVFQALLNFTQDVCDCMKLPRGEANAENAKQKARDLVELVRQDQARIVYLRSAVSSLGSGGSIMREVQATNILETDDKIRREWVKS